MSFKCIHQVLQMLGRRHLLLCRPLLPFSLCCRVLKSWLIVIFGFILFVSVSFSLFVSLSVCLKLSVSVSINVMLSAINMFFPNMEYLHVTLCNSADIDIYLTFHVDNLVTHRSCSTRNFATCCINSASRGARCVLIYVCGGQHIEISQVGFWSGSCLG